MKVSQVLPRLVCTRLASPRLTSLQKAVSLWDVSVSDA